MTNTIKSILSRGALAILAVSLFSSCTTAQNQPNHPEGTGGLTAMKTLSDRIVQELTTDTTGESRNIAVTPFEGPEYVAPLIQDEIISAFLRARIPGLAIFERSGLNKVIAEANLALSGLVEEESAVTIGTLTGVDAVLIGTIQELSGSFIVSARLVDTANGMIIAAGRGEVPAVSAHFLTGNGQESGKSLAKDEWSILDKTFRVTELVLKEELQPPEELAVRKIVTTGREWIEFNRSNETMWRGSITQAGTGSFEVTWTETPNMPERAGETTRYNYHRSDDTLMVRIIVGDYEIGYLAMVEE